MEHVRQIDVGPVPKRPPQPSAPIPGSTRDRVQKQAERLLPGIGSLEVERTHVKPSGPVRGAWGEAASAGGFALALTLRSNAFKWTVRVLMLVVVFVLPALLSGLVMTLGLVWGAVGSATWVRKASASKKGVDTCQCGH